MVVVEDDAKARASLREGLLFFWRIERTDGHVYDQFDDSGGGLSLGEHCKMLEKSPLDLYADTLVATGIRRAAWVPATKGLQIYSVELEPTDEGLVLYRKTYRGTGGLNYFAYVIGRRFEVGDKTVEHSWYICPPMKVSPTALFRGGITESEDPLHQNAFDQFMDQQGV